MTFNLKDFPDSALRPFDMEAIHPDDFVLAQIDLNEGAVVSAIYEQAQSLRRPPQTVQDVLASLLRNGLVQSVARLRELLV